MKRLPLTTKQAAFLAILRELCAGDVPPTYQKIAEVTGLAKSQVHYKLIRLRDRGWVTFEDGRRQTLRILENSLPDISHLSRRDLLELRGRVDAALGAGVPA